MLVAAMEGANPAVRLSVFAARPPLEDPWGSGLYFEVRWENDAKRAQKALKRDFLGAVERMLREAADVSAQFIVGRGQGATILLGLLRPTVVEQALYARAVSPDDARRLAASWQNIRGMIAIEPRLYAGWMQVDRDPRGGSPVAIREVRRA